MNGLFPLLVGSVSRYLPTQKVDDHLQIVGFDCLVHRSFFVLEVYWITADVPEQQFLQESDTFDFSVEYRHLHEVLHRRVHSRPHVQEHAIDLHQAFSPHIVICTPGVFGVDRVEFVQPFEFAYW